MQFPDSGSLELGVESLVKEGHKVERQDGSVLVADPWGTKVRLNLTP
jgi:hypothetical protein